jgi:uncharacterized damage-inducible protein DinB
MTFERALHLHADAVAGFLSTVERVPADRWKVPRAEGKWSPAETLEHLAIAYDVLLRELETGVGMKVVTSVWQRLLLRVTMVPRILRTGIFPKNARAPREVRPQMPPSDKATAIAAFREKADRFAAEVARTRAARPRARLTHAYFGSAPLADGLLLVARHIEHHRRQLE